MPSADPDDSAGGDGGHGGYGGYIIEREVGRGGHATVYRAHHVSAPARPVALKVLDAAHRNPADRTRLDREFGFANRLRHPHIVGMYGSGSHWLAMQFVDGGDATRLRFRDDRLAALAQIAGALDYAHRHGIVHCDVKPENILVGKDFGDSGAVLTDFGAAYAVVEGRRPARPPVSLPYTAPEILRGQLPSAASDEYALACAAVELFTGTPPFPASNAAEVVEAHLHRMPPRMSAEVDWLPRAFDTVLATALAKTPRLRYRSCTELVDHLAGALSPPR